MAQLPPDTRDAVRITVLNEHQRSVFARRPSGANGVFHTNAPGVAPGGYEIRVTGTRPGSPIAPVTTTILIRGPARAFV